MKSFAIYFLVIFVLLENPGACGAEELSEQDPAAWGDEHQRALFPDYVTGDECLFCHRNVGKTWAENRHTQTVRPLAPNEPAPDTASHAMGHQRMTRFLKRSNSYGKLDLHTSRSPHGSNRPAAFDGQWDTEKFANQCAGCHTTAVDSRTKAFSALAIDCVACHGSVDLAHSSNPSKVVLSKDNRDPRVVVSVCGQCHLRGGKSASTGLPWPNTFLAGDNLFRDYRIPLNPRELAKLAPVDRHIFENARDVAVLGKKQTCLTCHDVHRSSSQKHQELPTVESCRTCHERDPDTSTLTSEFTQTAGSNAHSRICEY